MTERQKYEVIKLIDDVEIRRYLPYVAADVVVNEEYEKAGNAGFRPLANYIFSNKNPFPGFDFKTPSQFHGFFFSFCNI